MSYKGTPGSWWRAQHFLQLLATVEIPGATLFAKRPLKVRDSRGSEFLIPSLRVAVPPRVSPVKFLLSGTQEVLLFRREYYISIEIRWHVRRYAARTAPTSLLKNKRTTAERRPRLVLLEMRNKHARYSRFVMVVVRENAGRSSGSTDLTDSATPCRGLRNPLYTGHPLSSAHKNLCVPVEKGSCASCVWNSTFLRTGNILRETWTGRAVSRTKVRDERNEACPLFFPPQTRLCPPRERRKEKKDRWRHPREVLMSERLLNSNFHYPLCARSVYKVFHKTWG